jgi:hypothetical protein
MVSEDISRNDLVSDGDNRTDDVRANELALERPLEAREPGVVTFVLVNAGECAGWRLRIDYSHLLANSGPHLTLILRRLSLLADVRRR